MLMVFVVVTIIGYVTIYLSDRKQQAVLNDESSSWTTVTRRVPQGSQCEDLSFSAYL